MPKNHKYEKISPETQEEAIKIAKATQRPGQTKEQTKLISQGIEKGINQFKKQQKVKSRELNKKAHKATLQKPAQQGILKEKKNNGFKQTNTIARNVALPWILLVLSWAGFAAYLGTRV